MGKYRKILVALDGSESAHQALAQSFALARDEKCWLLAATVVPGVDGDLELVGLGDVRAALRKPGEAILERARALAEAERVPLKTVLEEGEAWERIVHLADDERCDLIVMGRRGLRRLERVMMGSVTARVIGHADRDVLVVPQGTQLSFKRVLVATDGSPASSAGADHAVNIAASYGGELVALAVVDLPDEAYADAPGIAEQLLEKAKEYVAAVTARAAAAGVPCTTATLEGPVHEVVTRLARERQAGLIVTGSHGRTGLRRLLLGSVAEKVIGYAPCPVLVVKG
jgi:nucleotide-binding universal stress UspA family protein